MNSPPNGDTSAADGRGAATKCGNICAWRAIVCAILSLGSAALLAYAGLRAAVMNVRVNLKGIKDQEKAAKARERVRRLEIDAERLREEALAAAFARMNSL